MNANNIIRIEQEAVEAIQAMVAESARDCTETGGFLVGEITKRGRNVLHAIGPGRSARRTAVRFEPDYLHAVRKFKELNTNGKLKIVGGWHIHDIDGLSSGDEATLKSVCVGNLGFLALVVCGFSKRSFRIFTVEDGAIRERKWKVFEKRTHALDFDRTVKLFDHGVLSKKKVLVMGAGSGGSIIATYLGRAGVGYFIIADNEKLEEVNLIRHIGKFHQVGMAKAEIFANELRLINPDVKVKTVEKKLEANTVDEFEKLVKGVHLVLACSGSTSANQLLNEICHKLRKPVIIAGVFEKASGGFVLQNIPYLKNSPCLNCIYDYAENTQDDSNEQLRHMAQDYGMSEEELSAQQGLYIDISFVALLQAKIALITLLRGSKHDLGKLPGNLAIWESKAEDSVTMTTRWVKFKKRDDCVICNPDGWLKSRGFDLEEDELKEVWECTN